MILFKFLSLLTSIYVFGCLAFVIILIRETLKNGVKNYKLIDQLSLIVLWPINLSIKTKLDRLIFNNGKETKKKETKK